jgi:glycosyltransferase involved in cell wall biosynthesis
LSRSLSVIVATYEWPNALDIVLRALSEQRDQEFDVVVSDDGSGSDTADVVEKWSASTFSGRIRHAWQPDDGYRRARALNLGASVARGTHLAYIDGDSLPRRRFVEAVKRALLPGWFLAGKRVNLGRTTTERVFAEQLPIWRWPALVLIARVPRDVGRPGFLVPLRDRRRPWRSGQSEFRPPFNRYGSPFVVAREDFERVNGFDTRFEGWGQEDEDIALRLRRARLRCGWPGPKSTLLHLWHPSRVDRSRPNDRLLSETRASDRVEAIEGFRELVAQERANRVGASSSSSDPVKR